MSVHQDTRSLVSLDPERPESYLIVGEDLARSNVTQYLASQVLATGALIAVERSVQSADPAAAAIAGSMIVALASLTDDADTRSGLWMLAISVDPSQAESFRWLSMDSVSRDRGAADAARVLGGLRRNDRAALRDITDATRERIIDEGETLGMNRAYVAALLRNWERNAREDPCNGRLFVRVREGDRVIANACPKPEFHHGEQFTDEWAAMVAIELSLSGHTPASWPIRGSIGLDKPVPIWTPDRLGQDYSVSSRRPFFRNGRWTER